MNRRALLAWAYAVCAAVLALAIPKMFLVTDPWIDAARSVRQMARPGDLAVLYPAQRVDRLAAFDGVWAVAADPTVVGSPERVARIFWIGDEHVPPPAGFAVQWSRRFGAVSVRLLTNPRVSP